MGLLLLRDEGMTLVRNWTNPRDGRTWIVKCSRTLVTQGDGDEYAESSDTLLSFRKAFGWSSLVTRVPGLMCSYLTDMADEELQRYLDEAMQEADRNT